MKEYLFTDKLAKPPVGYLLVEVENTYDERVSKGGIVLPNMAHEEAEADSKGYNLSQWIIRSGKVVTMAESNKNVDYDWSDENEIQVGDLVYWSIVNFFDAPVLRKDDRIFLLIKYHDILIRIRDGVITPVNGFYLFTKIKKTKKALFYEVEKRNFWYKLEQMSKEVVYEDERFNFEPEFKEGWECFLLVPPIQIEADTNINLDKEYFVAQKRHILMSCEQDSNI